MTPVGWGIIGIGRHANDRMAPAIRAVARLVAVSSRDEERAAAFGARHGAKGYGGIDAMLADPEVEAVYVGSPHGLHAEHTLACIAAGKHVLVDKPMATTIADAEAMISAAEKAGVLLVPGHNVRYQAAHTAAKQLLASGLIGTPIVVKVESGSRPSYELPGWRTSVDLGGGSLLNIGPHGVEMLRYITGREIDRVAAQATFNENGFEELTVAALTLSGGVLGTLMTSRVLPFPANGVTVQGTLGRLQTIGTLAYEITGSVEVTTSAGTRVDTFTPTFAAQDVFTNEISEVGNAIRTGAPVRVAPSDGLTVLRVLSAIEESAKTGRTVDVM